MKICIVCPYNINSAGGVQTHIRDSAKEMTRLGHSVTVISPGSDTGNPLPENYIQVGKCRKIVFNQTEFDISLAYGDEYRKLKQLLSAANFDVIHFHTIWTPLLPVQILWLSNTVRVATFHDTPPDTFAGKLTRALFICLGFVFYRLLDAMIAVSPSPARHLPKRNDKLHIIPPCSSLEQFQPVKTGTADNKIRILFLGRLEERKGIMVLLEAFRKLVEDGLDVQLRIAGSGRLEGKVREFIKQHNLQEVTLTGAVSNIDKHTHYAGCDIFCSPAMHGESFGIVLVEAMASGKPVVAADNSGYINILGKKKLDCLCKPGDVIDLYEKLRHLVVNRELRMALGDWGRQESGQYDCSTIVPRIIDLYRKLLNQ